MKPYVKLAESTMPDGTTYSLHKHDGEIYLKYNGFELMSTALTYSEQMLADYGCQALKEGKGSRPTHPKILIGGLGLGFTL
ncbi:MAG: spermine synthase, partial [Akkermansiaceae bacterium]